MHKKMHFSLEKFGHIKKKQYLCTLFSRYARKQKHY